MGKEGPLESKPNGPCYPADCEMANRQPMACDGQVERFLRGILLSGPEGWTKKKTRVSSALDKVRGGGPGKCPCT